MNRLNCLANFSFSRRLPKFVCPHNRQKNVFRQCLCNNNFFLWKKDWKSHDTDRLKKRDKCRKNLMLHGGAVCNVSCWHANLSTKNILNLRVKITPYVSRMERMHAPLLSGPTNQTSTVVPSPFVTDLVFMQRFRNCLESADNPTPTQYTAPATQLHIPTYLFNIQVDKRICSSSQRTIIHSYYL